MAKKNTKNYLDFVAEMNPNNTWEEKDGIVIINMIHRGFYHKLAQKVFHKPSVSHIELDKLGSFVWKQIDGNRSVYDVAQIAKKQFGDEIEPVYERIVKYFQILKNNQFIVFKGDKR